MVALERNKTRITREFCQTLKIFTVKSHGDETKLLIQELYKRVCHQSPPPQQNDHSHELASDGVEGANMGNPMDHETVVAWATVVAF